MQRFEIFNATHTWKGCADMRPWLIVELRGTDTLGCFPISGECYGGSCFWIDPSHPDFSKTGLKKGCYVHDDYVVEIGIDEFQNRRGELMSELLDEFVAFSGL